MGLQRDQAGRRFDRTPQPSGQVARARSAAPMRFVVQKHAAATLHYDLRLEMDGVLKSWAVTKEPSGDASIKRLAVRTGDQPLELADFDGDMAEPPWDQGTWLPEEAPLTSLRRGKLTFELKGRRMKGRWTLMRMGNASTRKKDLWLLTKLADGEGAAGR